MTFDIRNALKTFVEDNIGTIQGSFDCLDAKERLNFISQILPFIIPKYQSTQLQVETPPGEQLHLVIEAKDIPTNLPTDLE